MAREYMCAYHSLLETAQRLNDAEFGRLMRAAISYSASGESPTLSGRELMLWDMIKWQIDRDIEKFKVFTEKQAENGRKGGRPKKPTETQKTQAFSEKPTKAKAIATTNNDKQIAYHNPLTPLEGAIEDFKAHRKQLKKPMTDRAVHLLRNELEKLAPSDEAKQIAIIEQSIANGWQGVFELKTDARQTRRGANKDYPQRAFNQSDLEGILLNLEEG